MRVRVSVLANWNSMSADQGRIHDAIYCIDQIGQSCSYFKKTINSPERRKGRGAPAARTDLLEIPYLREVK